MVADTLDAPADESAASARATGSDPGTARWKRIGGVAVGGALLALGLRRRSLLGAAMALVGGWTAYRAVGSSGPPDEMGGTSDDADTESAAATGEAPTVTQSITIDASGDELSELVSDPETLDRIVGGVAEVTVTDEDRHRWTADAPLGRSLSLETRVSEEEPGERVRWESTEDAAIATEWTVEFSPAAGGRGTDATLVVSVDPPGGSVGSAAAARLAPAIEALVGPALDRLKSLAETGEIPTTKGSPSGREGEDLL